MHQHNIPSMAMAWITDGEVAEVRAFGTYDDHRAIPVNAIYNVASLTHVRANIRTLHQRTRHGTFSDGFQLCVV